MSRRQLLGFFDREEDILAATRAVRQAGFVVADVYSPYAVHGLDKAMGLKPSRLPWVCFALGLLGAAAVSRLLSSLLFEVEARDPLTFIAVPVLLILVSFTASYLPARRAASMDPVASLYHE